MVTPFVVKNAATAAAKATAGAARIAITEKAAKAFAGGMKSIEKSYESGALQSVENIFQNIQSSGPIASVFQYISALIAGGTMDETLGLGKDIMDWLASAEGKATMTEFIGFLNTFLVMIREIGEGLVYIEENSGAISGFFAGVKGFIEDGFRVKGIIEGIAGSTSKLSEAASNFIAIINRLFELLEESWLGFLTQISDKIEETGLGQDNTTSNIGLDVGTSGGFEE